MNCGYSGLTADVEILCILTACLCSAAPTVMEIANWNDSLKFSWYNKQKMQRIVESQQPVLAAGY